MVKFFEYLFHKYHLLQVRVGNGITASVGAIGMILYFLMIYYWTFWSLLLVFVSRSLITIETIAYLLVIFLIILTLYLYFKLIYKGKSKRILNSVQLEKSSSLVAILFPILGIILWFSSMMLMMLQNQGKMWKPS